MTARRASWPQQRRPAVRRVWITAQYVRDAEPGDVEVVVDTRATSQTHAAI
jgi:hypothetical protein